MIQVRARSFLLLLSLCLVACGKATAPTAAPPPESAYLVAVNRPLQYFAQRLLGPEADVRMPAPAGTDPAAWSPSVQDVQALQGAQLVLLNGAGYSPWLATVALSDSRLVVTAADRQRWIQLQDQVTHSHGPE